MANPVLFNGTFKTVKKGEGKDATYDLILIIGEGEKVKETLLGNHPGLVKAKSAAGEYVAEKDPKATQYKMIHHKPGREKDAKEVLTVTKKSDKTA